MWLTYLSIFVVSFMALLIARPISQAIGLVDKPNYRKRHHGAIPLIGGVSLFCGNIAFYAIEWQQMQHPYLYLSSIVALFIIGVLDDRFDISPFIRGVVQVSIALAIIYHGLSIHSLGQIIAPFNIELGFGGAILTIFVIIGVINAFNMIDGIDGLLSSLSCVSFAGIGTLMYLDGQQPLAYWCFAIIIILLPYTLFNLNAFGKEKKVFMGDSGSTQIGFTLIWILLLSTQSKNYTVSPITGLWLIAIPVIDMIAIILRRLKKGKSPFKADRLHIHHLMVRSGLSSHQALAIITFGAIVCCCVGVLGETRYWNQWAMSLALIILYLLYSYSINHAWRVIRWIKRLKRRTKKQTT